MTAQEDAAGPQAGRDNRWLHQEHARAKARRVEYARAVKRIAELPKWHQDHLKYEFDRAEVEAERIAQGAPMMASKPRLLDAYSGAGGCAEGYARAGFELVGVDINPQPNYPFEFHRADARDFIAEHWWEFDAIHASPPCQSYLNLGAVNRALGREYDHPDLIAETRRLLIATGLPYRDRERCRRSHPTP